MSESNSFYDKEVIVAPPKPIERPISPRDQGPPIFTSFGND